MIFQGLDLSIQGHFFLSDKYRWSFPSIIPIHVSVGHSVTAMYDKRADRKCKIYLVA